MNILFVSISLRFGGAERCMSLLANEFVRQGHSVNFVLTDEEVTPAYELDDSIRVYSLGGIRFNRLSTSVKPLIRLRHLFKILSPNVIVSFFSNTAVFALLSQIGLRIPVVFSERNDPAVNSNSWQHRFFRAILLKWARYFVFQTKGARAFYGQKVLDKSSIILNPINAQLSHSGFTYQNKKETIVSVGRLNPQKNQMLLIDAFSRIAQEFSEYKLIIWGEGPLRDTLEEHIMELGLSERVFLPGNSSNIFDEISSCSLFVLSSDYEGLPNALIEAMCLGLPCISTDCSPGGARELIVDGENGLIVPCRNPEALAKAITSVLLNPEMASRMGMEAKRISEKTSLDTVSKQWLSVFSMIQ